MASLTFNQPTVEDCVKYVAKQELAVPGFQRDYVWSPAAAIGLMQSLSLEYPIGAPLVIEVRGMDPGTLTFLDPAGFSHGPLYDSSKCVYLVLDGQQRMTTLWQVLTGCGKYLFFLDVEKADQKNWELDDECLVHLPNDPQKNVKKYAEWTADADKVSTPMLWLGRVFNHPEHQDFEDWCDDVPDPKIRSLFAQARKGVIKSILNYKMPWVQIPCTTTPAALCGVYETLNNTGTRLSVFDLMVAKVFHKGLNLKIEWESGVQAATYGNLARFDVDRVHVLWAIALLTSGRCRRNDVLALKKSDFEAHLSPVMEAYDEVLQVLVEECGVLSADLLPYPPMLVAMAAAFASLDKKAKGTATTRNRLKRWFWCRAFGGEYVEGAQTKAISDFPVLREWLASGVEPDLVSGFRFGGSLEDAASGSNALFQTTMCLILSMKPKDFCGGSSVGNRYLADRMVDIHHIFPADWMAKNCPMVPTCRVNSILNKTYITAKCNRGTISNQAPSDYLAGSLAAAWAGDAIAVSKMLERHLINASAEAAMRTDDFDAFMATRQLEIERQIAAATGS